MGGGRGVEVVGLGGQEGVECDGARMCLCVHGRKKAHGVTKTMQARRASVRLAGARWWASWGVTCQPTQATAYTHVPTSRCTEASK